MPYTRSKYGLPRETQSTKVDYSEVFDETPIWTLFRMFIMQALYVWSHPGFLRSRPLTGCFAAAGGYTFRQFISTQSSPSATESPCSQNVMGSPAHPPGTNHFKPDSTLFKPEQSQEFSLADRSKPDPCHRKRHCRVKHWHRRCNCHSVFRRARIRPLAFSASIFGPSTSLYVTTHPLTPLLACEPLVSVWPGSKHPFSDRTAGISFRIGESSGWPRTLWTKG